MGLLDYIDEDAPLFGGLFGGGRSAPPVPPTDAVSGVNAPSVVAPIADSASYPPSTQGQPPSELSPWVQSLKEPYRSAVQASAVPVPGGFDGQSYGDAGGLGLGSGTSESNVGASRFDNSVFDAKSYAGANGALSQQMQKSAAYRNPRGGGLGGQNIPENSRTDEYIRYIIQHESGGKADAQSATSSAAGSAQFTKGTWLSVLRKYRPDITGTDAEKLALRHDPYLSQQMAKALTAENAAALTKAGIDPTLSNTYLAHFAGVNGATKILTADPSTPVEQILGPKAMAANAFLKGKTAGDMQAWSKKVMNDAKAKYDGKMAKMKIQQASFQPGTSVDLSTLHDALQSSGNRMIFLGR